MGLRDYWKSEGFTGSTANVLANEGMKNLQDIANLSHTEWMRVPLIGTRKIQEISEYLARHGKGFKGDFGQERTTPSHAASLAKVWSDALDQAALLVERSGPEVDLASSIRALPFGFMLDMTALNK